MEIKALVRRNKNPNRSGEYYVSRIYSLGWDDNLSAWEEEIRESFGKIIERFGDDPSDCHLQGEAKWVWMTRHKYPRIVVEEPKDSQSWMEATMIRVRRNNTPGGGNWQ